MRRARWLLPFLLLGCKPGRQAAVSNDGRVASTVEGGTFVSGRGRVAEGGDDVAWSPDGHTLAIAAKGGVTLWPEGKRLEGLGRPLAFSPLGDRIGGTQGKTVVIRDVATSAAQPTTIAGVPQKLGWTSDGRLFSVDSGGLQVDGGAKMALKSGSMVDAVPTPDGGVALLAWATTPKDLAEAYTHSLRLGSWNPADGSLAFATIDAPVSTFGAPSPRRLLIPLEFALMPDGRRFVASGLKIEAGVRSLARMVALSRVEEPTPAQEKEMKALVDAARITSVVVRTDATGRTDTLWTSPTDRNGLAPTDLALSPDGRWLAIAGKDGTVRVAVGE